MQALRLVATVAVTWLGGQALAAPESPPDPPTQLSPKAGAKDQAGPRVQSVQGEVRWRPATGSALVPLPADQALARRDEIDTGSGTATVRTHTGMLVEMSEGTLIAIIGGESGVDAYLAHGNLHVRPGDNGEVHSVQIVTSAGRVTLRGKDLSLRVDNDTTVVTVQDGLANAWGRGAVTVRSGQTSRLVKGAMPTPPRALPVAPVWLSGDVLHLAGERQAPLTLRWQPVPGADRYRVELTRTDAQAAPLLLEADDQKLSVEIRELPVGLYAARVSAYAGGNPVGEQSEPRRVIWTTLTGGAAASVIRPGTLPRLLTPVDMAAVMTIDGEPMRTTGLRPGPHRLQVRMGGLSTEIGVSVAQEAVALAQAQPTVPPVTAAATPPTTGRPPAREERPAQRPGTAPPAPSGEVASRPDFSQPPLIIQAPPGGRRAAAPDQSAGPGFSAAPAPDGDVDAMPAEDLLHIGPADVAGAGVRSPWAGRLVQVGGESTIRGEGRLFVHGRFTWKSGLGAEASYAALRIHDSNLNVGGLRLLARTPAWRRPRFALQGVVGALLPIGGSQLDSTLYEVPAGAAPLALARGGGWRVDAAVLFGVRSGRLWVHTQHGLSLRVTDGVLAGYEGGLAIQADASRHVRVLMSLQLGANLLGVLPDGSSGPDVGGAAGGGFEVFVPGPLGGARLAVLARAGLGESGAALYGRGSFAAQLGYRFR